MRRTWLIIAFVAVVASLLSMLWYSNQPTKSVYKDVDFSDYIDALNNIVNKPIQRSIHCEIEHPVLGKALCRQENTQQIKDEPINIAGFSILQCTHLHYDSIM